MSTRRRIGVSTATTEAARRQLMQPVPCWEKVWEAPEGAAPGSTLKVYKWVKTDRKQVNYSHYNQKISSSATKINNEQNFSDDEEEPDMPLAPLPDIEQEGDEDMEQDDQTGSVAPETASRAVSEPASAPQEPEEPSASVPPKPHPLSVSMVPDSPTPAPEIDEANLDAELKPPEQSLDMPPVLEQEDETQLQVPLELSADLEVTDLEMAGLGPDGTQFEAAGNLDQLQGGTDALLGGEAMDETTDPFIATT